MIRRFQIRDLVILFLGVIVMYQLFFNEKDDITEPKEITIVIPERKGSTGDRVIEEVREVPVYIPEYKETIVVDNKYKEMYEATKDSIGKLNLYLNAIKINKYEETFVSNDTIEITGEIKTRGDLIGYKLDYEIKPQEISYEPEVVVRRPRNTMQMSMEAGVPTIPTTGFAVKGRVGFTNRSGTGLSVGYDTDSRLWVGVSKTITIRK